MLDCSYLVFCRASTFWILAADMLTVVMWYGGEGGVGSVGVGV